MENRFPTSSYDTPLGRRNLLSKITFNSRFNFFIQTVINFGQTAWLAHCNRLNRENQVIRSNRNIDIIEHCGGQIHLRGLHHLSSEPGPFVVIGNHMSSLETAVFHAILGPQMDFTFVIKRSLLHLPFLGAVLRSINAIPVDRENPREDFKAILKTGAERLEQGRSVLIFPEGTRHQQFEPENFNTIGIKLAKNANVKIIPFALKTDFLDKGKIFTDFGPLRPERQIYFEFGAPLSVTGNGRQEHQQIIDFITERLAEWQKIPNNEVHCISGVGQSIEL